MRHAFISLCQPLKLLNTFFGNVRDGNIYEIIRETFPALMYLYSLMGTIWPSCYLHCGWIIDYYGFDLPDESAQHKTYLFLFFFCQQTHSTYLRILLCSFQINHVYHRVPQTSFQQSFSPLSVSSICSVGNLIPLTPPNNPFDAREVVSPSATPLG